MFPVRVLDPENNRIRKLDGDGQDSDKSFPPWRFLMSHVLNSIPRFQLPFREGWKVLSEVS
jgi:hypothetical protein